VRLHLIAGPAPDYAIARGCAPERAFCARPRRSFRPSRAPRRVGHFPREMSGEQSYWTSSRRRSGGIGAVFPRTAASSPAGTILDRALRVRRQRTAQLGERRDRASLEEGYCRYRQCSGAQAGLSLRITAFATGSARAQLSWPNMSWPTRPPPTRIDAGLAVRLSGQPAGPFLNSPVARARFAALPGTTARSLSTANVVSLRCGA